MGRFPRMLAAALVLACAVANASAALAISKENMEQLKEHFAGMGEVTCELYAPLGGPEIGAVQLGGGSQSKLEVVRVDGKGRFETLLSEPVADGAPCPAFIFLNGGDHFLSYSTQKWSAPDGTDRLRGDIVVHDLTAEGGPKELYRIEDVIDARYQAGERKFQDNLIWQPLPHFLNTGERLPVRNQYSRLLFDDVTGEYHLTQHLTALPKADEVPAANLNNRAIMFYRAGHLARAEQFFSQAAQSAGDDQGIVLHNNELVNSEIEELERQGKQIKDRLFDEALMYYWQGRFQDALTVLQRRQKQEVADFDLALLLLSLAQEKRWSEVKQSIGKLQTSPKYADALGELARIARLQGPSMAPIHAEYLTLLEQHNRAHPEYAMGIAVLQLQAGKPLDAQRTLETALRSADSAQDWTDARLMLYELNAGGLGETDTLVARAGESPLTNLYGYTLLHDYVDLRPALKDVAASELDIFEIKGRLENAGFVPDDAAGSDVYRDLGLED